MKKKFKKKYNKSGMTLIETIVAIAIFTISMQAITLLFIKNWQARSFIMEEGQATLTVSRAVDGMVKNLRKIQQPDNGEFPIKSGGAFDLVVFFDIDNDNAIEKVHYFLENSRVYEGISEPNGSPPVYSDDDENVKMIANDIVNESDDPMFSYYNKNYPADTANNPLSVPVNVSDVRLIKIHLMINIDPIKAPNNVNLETFVQLRNINDYMQ